MRLQPLTEMGPGRQVPFPQVQGPSRSAWLLFSGKWAKSWLPLFLLLSNLTLPQLPGEQSVLLCVHYAE